MNPFTWQIPAPPKRKEGAAITRKYVKSPSVKWQWRAFLTVQLLQSSDMHVAIGLFGSKNIISILNFSKTV
jgi:hypothetical protein